MFREIQRDSSVWKKLSAVDNYYLSSRYLDIRTHGYIILHKWFYHLQRSELWYSSHDFSLISATSGSRLRLDLVSSQLYFFSHRLPVLSFERTGDALCQVTANHPHFTLSMNNRMKSSLDSSCSDLSQAQSPDQVVFIRYPVIFVRKINVSWRDNRFKNSLWTRDVEETHEKAFIRCAATNVSTCRKSSSERSFLILY